MKDTSGEGGGYTKRIKDTRELPILGPGGHLREVCSASCGVR